MKVKIISRITTAIAILCLLIGGVLLILAVCLC